MTDLATELRREAACTEELHPDDSEIEVMRRAADEIERLRAALTEIRDGTAGWVAHAAAVALHPDTSWKPGALILSTETNR